MPGSLSGHERAGFEKPALQASRLLHKSADPYRNREGGLEDGPRTFQSPWEDDSFGDHRGEAPVVSSAGHATSLTQSYQSCVSVVARERTRKNFEFTYNRG